MASYHLSAQEFSRGAGHSAVAAAAYRARCALVDGRTGLRHDYSRKTGELLWQGIYAPKDAPGWAQDRAQLWNHVEAFEKHRRAILAREFVIALPHELTLEQNRYALQDFIRENFTRKGLIADATIHAPDREGDQRNVHAHVMVVTRRLDGSEFIRSKERFDTYSEKDAARKAELLALRENWARIGNRHLARHGFEPTLDHRTLEAQGLEREPTQHMGKAATAIERKGETSELGAANREIAVENERRVIDLAAERAKRETRGAAAQDLSVKAQDMKERVNDNDAYRGASDYIDACSAEYERQAEAASGLPNPFRPPAPQNENERQALKLWLGELEQQMGKPISLQDELAASVPPMEQLAAKIPLPGHARAANQNRRGAPEPGRYDELKRAAAETGFGSPERDAATMSGLQDISALDAATQVKGEHQNQRGGPEPLSGQPAEPTAASAHSVLSRAEKFVSGLFVGLGDRLGAAISYLSDLITPPPPPTKEQVEGMKRAAEEQREHEARVILPAAEQEARFQEIREQQARARRREREHGLDREDLDRDR